MIATTFLDLIIVLLWPLALAAAAWVIAIKALAATDEISEVVEALTRPIGIGESAERGDVSLRRGNLSPIAGGEGGWFQVHFNRMRHVALNISGASGRAMKRARLRDDDRRGDRAIVAGILRDHKISECASP